MTASIDDLASNQKYIIQNLSKIAQILQGLFGNTGTFTWNGAAATTVVANTSILANSQVLLIPTNAAAATLMGSNECPYVSSRSTGASFTVATAAGTAAAGTETFFYVVIPPAT